MLHDSENFDVDAMFEEGLADAGQLWRRFGEKPIFRGKDVLEVGSGLGFLTASIALEGAGSVLGVDIWQPRVDWCRRKVAERFPQLSNIRFDSTPTDRMEGSGLFDIIVSENTFEHIADIDAVLASFRRLLKPGGQAFIGFSPLYHSPFGDHGELRAPVRLPWLHLLAGESKVIASFNRANLESATSLIECGFNGLKPGDFVAAFQRSGLTVDALLPNRTDRPAKQIAMNACSVLAKLPLLRPYFTFGMYVTLRRPATEGHVETSAIAA